MKATSSGPSEDARGRGSFDTRRAGYALTTFSQRIARIETPSEIVERRVLAGP